MKKFIFTFPEVPQLINHYQVVYADNLFQAQSSVFERFGVVGVQIPSEKAAEFESLTNKRNLNPIRCKGVDKQ
ncbi:hypothetical protein RBU61_14285 [Tissierella sp. MB52-C2]|uniref:hypothetical protein n=1 Tax=Tissierella sp. MB52-C2 TaxID=3070999 RepID=UPI00280AAE37|nr:hypothetical protein [Tissierella sp. MB52-C2]WMM24084.1 hypothetical protein RBU61_14285 [Tissierella sp. MB52-C2]